MATVDRDISVVRAYALGWGAYTFYTVACAWPEAGGWPMAPGWVFIVACLLWGLIGTWRGWVMWAGCGAGCLAAPMFRAAVADNGAGPAVAGFVLALLAMMLLLERLAGDVLVDDRGRIPARHAACGVWLCGMIAAGGGVLLADLVEWAVRYAA